MSITAQSPKGGAQPRKAGAQPRPLQFARVPHPTMPQDCIVIVSHHTKQDGYTKLRPRGGGPAQFAHRLAFSSKYGPIPEGFEADHLCFNRRCVHRKHLRLLKVSVHRGVTNITRTAKRREEAKAIWEAHGRPAASVLSRITDDAYATCFHWIRRWEANHTEQSRLEAVLEVEEATSQAA